MNIDGELIAFFVFSLLAIGGAVFMINLTRVMHMALALAFALLSLAGIYILLEAPFLAVMHIMIYTGAVSVIMIFGIMLTKHKVDAHELEPPRFGFNLLSLLGTGLLFAIIMWVIYQFPFVTTGVESPAFKVQDLGAELFKQYMIPFEIASILLLAALIGAIVLARREENE